MQRRVATQDRVTMLGRVAKRRHMAIGPLAAQNIVLEQLIAKEEKEPEAREPSEGECIEHILPSLPTRLPGSPSKI